MLSSDHGDITLCGEKVSALPKKKWTDIRKENIGFIFQNHQLLPYLKAGEHLTALLCTDPQEVKKLFKELSIDNIIDQYPSHLSGGERQLVAIARAFASNAKLILADEPTGALDSSSSDDLLNLFSNINKKGQTILMVTHSIKAASHASRVLFIKDGELFHQLYKGNDSNSEFYQNISDTLTMVLKGGK